MRFLSHHELMRLFERALRRTGLPLRMTEGFNPHPIISFPTALGMAIESVDEIVEIELGSWVAPLQVQQKLAVQLPEGLRPVRVEAFDRRQRSYVDFAEYEARIPGLSGDVSGGIQSFLNLKEHVITRNLGDRSKTVNIRPYVLAVEQEGETILIRIRVTDSGSARPDEVLEAIGVPMKEGVRIRKTHTELKIR